MPMLVRLMVCVMLVVTATASALAQTSEAREMDDAVVFAYAHGTVGPAIIPLRDIATLKLPKDMVFVPAPASNRLLHGMGNGSNSSVLGVVIPAARYDGWFVALSMAETGHVSNTALASLDAGDIRAAFATAVRRGNAARMQLGSSPLDAGAFLEPPKHEPEFNRFTTVLRVFESGPSSGGEDSVTVDANVFGRAHTVQASLVDGITDYSRHRGVLDDVLRGVSFTAGHRAADFIAGRDAVAIRLIDVVFGGRTVAEIAAEAAEANVEAERIAALPPQRAISSQLTLALFAVLALLAVVAGAVAFSGRAGDGGGQPQRGARTPAVERALRATKR